MITNVQTSARNGQAVTWDGTNIEDLREVAGDAFAGVNATHALVRTGDGIEPVWVQAGWTIARFGGRVQVFSPAAAAFLLQETQEGGVVA